MTERVEEIRRQKDCTVCRWAFGEHSELCSVGVLLAALAQAEREREEIRESLEPGTAPRIVAGMFAEAEKRGMSPFSAKHALAWLCEQLDAARAEVERLKGEFIAAIPKCSTDVTDFQMARLAAQGWKIRAEQAEAALARVRAALDGTHFHHKAFEPECSHCQAQQAALEGRG